MGMFLSVSAIQNRTVEDVADAIHTNAAAHGIEVIRVRRHGMDQDSDATVPFRNGWTVITWPDHFLEGETVSQAVSEALQTLVSYVNVYDGDLWEHYLLATAGNVV